MDEDSQFGRLVKGALAATGLGAVAAVFSIPFPNGLYVALLILALAVVLFGGYFLWRRMRARREREQFTSAIEAQTAATPKAISDPNKRAELDRVRQKFQTGLQEFKSRSKDIYKLPWYAIIGESGSGKTEAIRHSGIDFPPGLQDELQGSGGTVNMDWWFTNRGIILDTAGSMLFNEARAGEAPEWREFLRLLKRARPNSPINGLFLVLSVESLIRDSADTIAQKASRLAQQLDIIQRALDVRFPVYLLITKCDLLTGFREFFDSIDDPLLQHQMFGWSNPDPLDAHFRPDLVEEHLRTVSGRLRRRRMALIRDISGTGRLGDTQRFFASNYQLGRGPTVPRRLDEFDSLFALPESIMRLAPRLRRYLETIFVAGEWSAKPVFLRGIYFTSSMREGKALDEAIALATGLALDQLPEDRSWDKNRAFFLRDLFHEKVFRESGLVTRATNTLQMLRRNQLIIFGSAGTALLLVLLFAGLGNYKLKKAVTTEAAYWKVGATHLTNGVWSPDIVNDSPVQGASYVFAYGGTNAVPVGGARPTLVQYQQTLCDIAKTNLTVPWLFKPLEWLNVGEVGNRPDAQRRLFESSVIKPLVEKSREKMRLIEPSPNALTRHRDALLALMEFEASGLINGSKGGTFPTPGEPAQYLRRFLAYLTDGEIKPDPALVGVFERTYSDQRLRENDENWPPRALRGGNTLSNNTAISIGLENFYKASRNAQTNIDIQLGLVNDLTDKLQEYQLLERNWLSNGANPCPLPEKLLSAKTAVDASWSRLQTTVNVAVPMPTNLASLYTGMAVTASNASASALAAPVNLLSGRLPPAEQGRGLFKEISDRLAKLGSGAADNIWSAFDKRRNAAVSLDAAYLVVSTNKAAAFEVRWSLYTNACALAAGSLHPNESTFGTKWKEYESLKQNAEHFRARLIGYTGPFFGQVSNLCERIASDSEQALRESYLNEYAARAKAKLRSLGASPGLRTKIDLTNASDWIAKIEGDVTSPGSDTLGPLAVRLEEVVKDIAASRRDILVAFTNNLKARLAFPLVRESAKVNSVQELSEARKDLSGVLGALQDSVWQGDRSGTLPAVINYCSNATAVLNALVKEDGTPAEWKLVFVPPAVNALEDKQIITIFAVAKLGSTNLAKVIPNLTVCDIADPKSCQFGSFTVNEPLIISFCKYRDSVPAPENTLSLTNWALIRLIQDGRAERLDEGARWRFHIDLVDGAYKGKVSFDAMLDTKQPLPKRETWP